MKILAGTLCLALVAAAHAQDAKTWRDETMKGYGECSIVGSAAHIMGTVGPQDIEKSRGCAEDRIQKARSEFAALPSAKPAAALALKEYCAAWIAAMQSLPSRLVQSRSGAATASAATKQRLDELWARVEIEASP